MKGLLGTGAHTPWPTFLNGLLCWPRWGRDRLSASSGDLRESATRLTSLLETKEKPLLKSVTSGSLCLPPFYLLPVIRALPVLIGPPLPLSPWGLRHRGPDLPSLIAPVAPELPGKISPLASAGSFPEILFSKSNLVSRGGQGTLSHTCPTSAITMVSISSP